MNTTKIGFAIAGLALALAAFVAGAQPPNPPGPKVPPDPHGDVTPQEVLKMVETLRLVRLSEALGLNDEETVLFMRRYKEYREESKKLRKERMDLVQRLKHMINTGANEEAISERLAELIAQDRKIADLDRSLFERVSKFSTNLTQVQKAKLYLFREEFDANMRKILRNAQGRGKVQQYRSQMRQQIERDIERPMRPGGPQAPTPSERPRRHQSPEVRGQRHGPTE